MNKLFLLLITVVCVMTSTSFAQNVQVEVCRFKDDKPAAISWTFDDGLLDHYTVLKPKLKAYGYQATFMIVIKWAQQAMANRSDSSKRQYMSWNQIKELAVDGHEIGNHSFTHYQLTKGDPANWDREINDPLRIFEDKLDIRPITFCYPGNAYNEQITKMVHVNHLASRLSHKLEIGNKHYTLEKTKSQLLNIIKNKQWAPIMSHAIIHQYHGWAPFPNDEKDLDDVLAFLKTIEDKLWIATFSDAVKYIKLRENHTIQWDKTGKEFTIKTDLDTNVYNLPLTVRITDGRQSKLISVMPNTLNKLSLK